jgi:transposase InsO family protein
MTNPTNTRRRFTDQQKQEAVALCLGEGLSCVSVAERLELPTSSLAKWVRQVRIDRGDFGPPDQGQLNSDERSELARLRKENRELRRQKDFFRLAAAHYGLRPTRQCLVEAKEQLPPLIQALSERFSIAWLCKQLGVARSGFYAWRQRQRNPGPQAQQNAAITAQAQTVFDRHRGFYGALRIHQDLRASGLKAGRHCIDRLMRCSDLKAKTRRSFRPCRTAARQPHGVADNLLNQQFSPTAPNRSWAGDITYIRTTACWRYLAVWIDLHSRRVVGWALSTTMETTLVLEALNRALGHRRIEPDQLLIHTDQGSQYRTTAYRQMLVSRKISCSMSAKGCCWDNVVAESFFSTLKH